MEEFNTDNSMKNENKKPMTTKEKVILGLKIAGNVVFYAIIIFLFFFSIMNIRGGNGQNNFPNIFGKGILTLQDETISMDRNEKLANLPEWADYEIGEITDKDLVHVDVFSEKDCSSLKVGQVITFFDKNIGTNGWLNTHRIVYISTDYSYVITQGDRIAQSTPFDKEHPLDNGSLEMDNSVEHVSVNDIKGVVTSVDYGAGGFLKNIQANWLWYFVVPVIVVLAFEIFLVIRNILIYREEKNGGKKGKLTEEEKAKMLEEEKARLREELLAEMKAQGLVAAAPVQETVVVEETKEEPVTEEVTEEVKETEATDEVVSDEIEK